ncbi:hypothetical protein P872_05110 [Rhodonellum psychrophilum GCM71 = DSM 17998]|uniref:Uncharacterized protein n=2 Tax=Rhodonellum TaxID=336827 RepID=U5BQY7_9BACT|nr:MULTISPECIES: hypothetical protein [Rhodonellum]ERM82995.1 hypothetical protein P872_05110 [Rhodonellum psychrophilum GCM71 = DSM 17998]MDO9553058.1 hypothetical protein [Rhodonellum sp.]SDZ36134.1 hypothetical protein SAMN05444412_11185 [Rhodonellum ikkaensis]
MTKIIDISMLTTEAKPMVLGGLAMFYFSSLRSFRNSFRAKSLY